MEAFYIMKNISEQATIIINNFISYLNEKEDLSTKTVKEYRSDLKHFANWFENIDKIEENIRFELKNIVTPTLTRYRDNMQKELKLMPATINRRIITLKRFFGWAIDNEYITRNPSKPIKLVPAEKSSPRKMTEREESQFINAVEKYGSLRDRTIVVLMLHTGLRTMEICDLTKEDVYIGKRSGHLTVRSGKRRKQREVPLNSTCRDILDYYLKHIQPDSYLFFSIKTGTRLSERALRFIIEKYMKMARLEGLSAHDLRHRFGYVMIANTPIHRLAQIMGHDSLDTTMIYVKATRNDLQNEVEKIAWK